MGTDDQWAKVVRHEGGLEAARKNRILESNAWAPTLTSSYRSDWKYASNFVEVANSTPRFLTPRECARLMGFPETFEVPSMEGNSSGHNQDIHSFYQQIGNAVVPSMIAAIADEVLKSIGK